MKKIIALTIALATVLSFAGCSKESENKAPEKETKEVSYQQTLSAPELTGELEEVKKKIAEELKLEGTLDIVIDAACGIYALDSIDIKDFAAFTMMEGTFPHEVVMVEAKDADAAKRVEEALGVKLEAFKEQSKGYSPEDYALAEKCKVEVNGNHVALFLSPKCDEMKAVYEESIK